MIVSIMHQEMRIWRKIVLSAILWLSMLAISCQGTDCGNIPRSNANGMFFGFENLGEFLFSRTFYLYIVFTSAVHKHHTTQLVKSDIDNLSGAVIH